MGLVWRDGGAGEGRGMLVVVFATVHGDLKPSMSVSPKVLTQVHSQTAAPREQLSSTFGTNLLAHCYWVVEFSRFHLHRDVWGSVELSGGWLSCAQGGGNGF